jgi:hypothetical protein
LVPVTAFFLILAAVTEFLFSCLEPTLFLPRCEAANAVAPVRTRNRAIDETTFA